jgi:hypothetical protein
MRFDMKALKAKIAKRHSEIQVGATYFLSNFYDKDGATVRVVSKSNKKNKCGWNSIINVEILDSDYHYYKIGETHTVNATNLYEQRHLASPEYRYGTTK